MHRWKYECNNTNSVLNYTCAINVNQVASIYFSNQHKEHNHMVHMCVSLYKTQGTWE